ANPSAHASNVITASWSGTVEWPAIAIAEWADAPGFALADEDGAVNATTGTSLACPSMTVPGRAIVVGSLAAWSPNAAWRSSHPKIDVPQNSTAYHALSFLIADA